MISAMPATTPGPTHRHPAPGPAPMPDAEGFAVAEDGTLLGWQSFGRGPAIVFANGIGVRYPGLAIQLAHLCRRFRVITWDYRGTGNSRLAHPDASVAMPTHAADLFTVMDALSVTEATVIGWSMGCQVGLEAIRLRPLAIRGFVMLSGTYGRPFDDSAVRALAPMLPMVWKTFARYPAPAQALLGAVQSNNRLLLPLLDLIRFKTRSAEPEVFLTQVACTASVETRTYMRTMLELTSHDAWDVLTGVRCPTLVLACRKDILTPAAVARRIAAAIPNAQCVVLDGLSHFGLIEDPDRVHAVLDPFLDACASGPPVATA